MKKVWMVGAWANNVGDRILQKSNADLLKENYTYCDFTYVNCQQTYFSPQLIDSMNREADMLFIAGGGLVFNRPQDKSNSGWQWNIKTKDIKNIKVPIVVNAIGFNKFPHDNNGFKDGMWENIQETINTSRFFSIRNTGTFNSFVENGIDMSKVQITPDCGMFIRPDKFEHDIFNNDYIKIGLNWATDRAEQRFNGNWRAKFNTVLDVCNDLVSKHNAKIYLIEHLMPNELNGQTKIEMREMFLDTIGNNGYVLFNKLNQELYPMFDYNAGFFADIYSKMDLVFGMRGHAGIVSFGMNTPFIGIGHHNKVKWFMEDVGLSDFFVKMDNDKDYDKLTTMSENILNNKQDIKCKIRDAFDSQLEIKNSWFNKIRKIFLE